jgi:hypothetical protein
MKAVVTEHSTVVAVKEQVYSDLGGEVAILDLKGDLYYGLDEVGARIWQLIQEPRTVADIEEILLSEYEVEPDRCRRDLIALLQKLAQEELIEVRDETPA